MTLQSKRFCFISELITNWWDLFSSYRLKRKYRRLFVCLKTSLNCAFKFCKVTIFAIMFCYFCLTFFSLQSDIQNDLYINDDWIGHCMPCKFYINEKIHVLKSEYINYILLYFLSLLFWLFFWFHKFYFSAKYFTPE